MIDTQNLILAFVPNTSLKQTIRTQISSQRSINPNTKTVPKTNFFHTAIPIFG